MIEFVIDGCPIKVIEPHDLILVKQLAGRPVDLLDIEALREALANGEWRTENGVCEYQY